MITAQTQAKPTPLPAGSVQINGAGATFPLPIYTEWTYAYSYVDPAVVINYQGIGSGGGKKAIVDGTVDFAGSRLTSETRRIRCRQRPADVPHGRQRSRPDLQHRWAKEVPAGTTLPALVLDRQTLVDIYNAKVTKWNDPAIVKLNPDLTDYLPEAGITVVHRSDGSGTTEIFTKALTAFSPALSTGHSTEEGAPGGPIRAEGSQSLGEDLGRARAIRAVHRRNAGVRQVIREISIQLHNGRIVPFGHFGIVDADQGLAIKHKSGQGRSSGNFFGPGDVVDRDPALATMGYICRSLPASYSSGFRSELEPAKSTVPSTMAFLPPPEPMP